MTYVLKDQITTILINGLDPKFVIRSISLVVLLGYK